MACLDQQLHHDGASANDTVSDIFQDILNKFVIFIYLDDSLGFI